MRSLKLKICGMRDLANIRDVAAHRPDYMGFIFYPGSPRCVPDDFTLPALQSIRKVGVFVNQGHLEILKKVKQSQVDYVQLHGNETPDECRIIKQEGIAVIKAFSVDEHFDFTTTVAYEPFCEFFLFDTKGKHFGGNALRFDWNVLKRYNQSKPFFLSGGLNESNIANVNELTGMNLFAVDLNSGVELEPGVKDIQKIENIRRKLNSSL